MDQLEHEVRLLHTDVTALKVDVAIVKTELTNHVTELRGDLKDIKTSVASLSQRNGSRDWKVLVGQAMGWLFALIVLIFQHLLK